MAPRPINKGTLVAVSEDRRKGRRPSAGGIGPVVAKKRKKKDGTIVSLSQDLLGSIQDRFGAVTGTDVLSMSY